MTASALQLFKVDPQLQNLFKIADTAKSPEERQYAEAAIREYAAGLTFENPDAVAAFIAHYDARAEMKRAEAAIAARAAQSLNSSADQEKSIADRVRAISLQVLKDSGQNDIAGEFYSLKREKVGGILALDLHSPDLIPPNFKQYSMTLDWAQFQTLQEALKETDKGRSLTPFVITAKQEPNKENVRQALEGGKEVKGARLIPRVEKLKIA